MLKIHFLIFFLVLILFFSCSPAEEAPLCEVTIGTSVAKDTKATEISTSIINAYGTSDSIFEREIIYFVRISKTQASQYHGDYPVQDETNWPTLVKNSETASSLDERWIRLSSDDTDLSLTLSQGLWSFEAKAFVLQYMQTTSGQVTTVTQSFLETPLMESESAVSRYINLNTSNISVSMEATTTPAQLTFGYTTSNGYTVKTYITQNLADWGTPYEKDAQIELSPGYYYVKALVYSDEDPSTPVFGDVSSIFIFPGLSQRLSGRFDTTGKTGISSQNDGTSGMEQALENSSTSEELILTNEIPVVGTPNDTEVGEPIFKIPESTSDITIDLDGNNMQINSSTFKPSDVLFHVDTGKTLNLLNNSEVGTSGSFTNTSSSNNGVGNNDLGAVIAVDGGTLTMDNLPFQGSIGGRAGVGAINFIGCYCGTSQAEYQVGAVNPCEGGTVKIVNASITATYGITNVCPPAEKNYTASSLISSTVSGAITIDLDHASFVYTAAAIRLKNISTPITIIIREGTTFSTKGSNKAINLENCSDVTIYTDSKNLSTSFTGSSVTTKSLSSLST